MTHSDNRTADTTDLDSIIAAMYDVISGIAGKSRDWDRFRSLYLPDARLMPIVALAGRTPAVRILSLDDYIRRVEPIFAVEDFWERETSRQTEIVGRIAHVLSSYESLRSLQGNPFETGTNSVQLFYDDQRWWIVNVMWNTSRSE